MRLLSREDRRFARQPALLWQSLVLVILFSSPRTDFATDKYWTGATSTTWDANNNWSGNAPSASDNAVFNSMFMSANQPTLAGNASVGGIWVTGTIGQNVTISGGSNVLTLTANTINGTSGLGILIDNTTAFKLTINCNLKVQNSQTWTNNTSNLFTVGGAVNTNGKALTINGSGSTTVSGLVSGNGSLTQAASGLLTLTGVNTYSGGTNINAGTLNVGSVGALGTSGTINFGGGILQYSALNTTDYSGRFSSTASQAYKIDTNGQIVTFATPLTSSGGALTKLGTGTLILSGANTYAGGTTIGAGTLQIAANERLADTGALTVSGGTFSLLTFTETLGTISLTSGSISGTGTGTLIGSSYNLQSGTVSAILGGTANLTKSTSGTVTLSGANTFTGSATVSGGTLILSANSPGALGSTSSITVNAGGTLLLGASNQINNSSSLELHGGTFATGGFSEGTTSSAGIGALTLTAINSHIDFGTGTTGTLRFASFSPGSFLLTIDNWTGNPGSAGSSSTDRLLFESDQSSHLGGFTFTGYTGAMEIALSGGLWEIVPIVPEPSTYGAGSLTLMTLLIRLGRRNPRHY